MLFAVLTNCAVLRLAVKANNVRHLVCKSVLLLQKFPIWSN